MTEMTSVTWKSRGSHGSASSRSRQSRAPNTSPRRRRQQQQQRQKGKEKSGYRVAQSTTKKTTTTTTTTTASLVFGLSGGALFHAENSVAQPRVGKRCLGSVCLPALTINSATLRRISPACLLLTTSTVQTYEKVVTEVKLAANRSRKPLQ